MGSAASTESASLRNDETTSTAIAGERSDEAASDKVVDTHRRVRRWARWIVWLTKHKGEGTVGREELLAELSLGYHTCGRSDPGRCRSRWSRRCRSVTEVSERVSERVSV